MRDVLHGVEVDDPFRWLEDGAAPATVEWVAQQNARTRARLDGLPRRAGLHARFLELVRAGTAVAPRLAGNRVFSLEREAREQAQVIARDAEDPDREPVLLVDPREATGDDTAAVDWFHPSRDGRLLAYGISRSGDERSTLFVLDVETGGRMRDEIPGTRAASVAWLPDGSAFAYTRYPEGAELGREVRWHRLGADWRDDDLVYADEDETAWPDVAVSLDGRWLILHVARGWARVDAHLIERSTGRRLTVIEGHEARTGVEVVGGRLFAVTNLDSPRGRVITASVEDPGVEGWETIVAEGEAVLEGLVASGQSLLVLSTEDAASRVRRHALGGSALEDLALPESGTVAGLDADPDRERAFLSFTSFARPAGLWRWTPHDGVRPWTRFELPLDPDEYAVEQRRYPSTDGAEVPVFLVRARSTSVSADTPTVLTAYGGFAIANSPAFGPGIAAWCDAGGQYVVAGIRGGGEYGEEWHRAGMLGRKQQVFDDFCAAADWLVSTGRTSRERLAVRGGSNGGLLVAAAMTQRPDLCRAAVCAVPLADMVRYHRFRLGPLWVPEYGDPERAEDFAWLYAYSPYHHVVDGTAYPATLVLTADADSRVDPLHARKLAARLQAATSAGEDRPILLRVETRAGHGAGKPATKEADELADVWAFVSWQLGVG